MNLNLQQTIKQQLNKRLMNSIITKLVTYYFLIYLSNFIINIILSYVLFLNIEFNLKNTSFTFQLILFSLFLLLDLCESVLLRSQEINSSFISIIIGSLCQSSGLLVIVINEVILYSFIYHCFCSCLRSKDGSNLWENDTSSVLMLFAYEKFLIGICFVFVRLGSVKEFMLDVDSVSLYYKIILLS